MESKDNGWAVSLLLAISKLEKKYATKRPGDVKIIQDVFDGFRYEINKLKEEKEGNIKWKKIKLLK